MNDKIEVIDNEEDSSFELLINLDNLLREYNLSDETIEKILNFVESNL